MAKIQPFTDVELKRGIQKWRSRSRHPDYWPYHFHNEGYACYDRLRTNTGILNRQWWDAFLPKIVLWKGTRGARQSDISSCVVANLGNLRRIWNNNIGHLIQPGTDIEDIDPANIEKFAQLVVTFKPTISESPLFTAQFCHLALEPRIFPVNENEIICRFSNYKDYYAHVKEEWRVTQPAMKNRLIREMKKEIGKNPYVNFPLKTKIIELCYIGRWGK